MHAKTMGGYASLLQSWAWHCMPFIAQFEDVNQLTHLFADGAVVECSTFKMCHTMI